MSNKKSKKETKEKLVQMYIVGPYNTYTIENNNIIVVNDNQVKPPLEGDSSK